jgi:hypothetical protein
MQWKNLLVFGAPLLDAVSADRFLPDLTGLFSIWLLRILAYMSTVNVNAVLKTGAENLMGFYNFAQIGVLPEPYCRTII